MLFDKKKLFQSCKKKWCVRKLEIWFKVSNNLLNCNFPTYSNSFFIWALNLSQNICIASYSTKIIHHKLKLNRKLFKKAVSSGTFFGIYKSVW